MKRKINIKYWQIEKKRSFVNILKKDIKEFAKATEQEWKNPKSINWLGKGYDFKTTATTGIWKVYGWAFDLKPVLKLYAVKKYYGYIVTYYAPSKNTLKTAGLFNPTLGDKLLKIY